MDGARRGGHLRRRHSRSRASNSARVVGKACTLELIIDDIRDELRGRPYEIVTVAGGWSFRTKPGFGDVDPRRARRRADERFVEGERGRADGDGVFSADHPRRAFATCLGREVSRDVIAALRGEGLIAAGPRSPTPGAPYAYVTTPGFLRTSASRACAICPISRSSNAGLIGRQARARSAATRWRSSCGRCSDCRTTKRRKTRRSDLAPRPARGLPEFTSRGLRTRRRRTSSRRRLSKMFSPRPAALVREGERRRFRQARDGRRPASRIDFLPSVARLKAQPLINLAIEHLVSLTTDRPQDAAVNSALF